MLHPEASIPVVVGCIVPQTSHRQHNVVRCHARPGLSVCGVATVIQRLELTLPLPYRTSVPMYKQLGLEVTLLSQTMLASLRAGLASRVKLLSSTSRSTPCQGQTAHTSRRLFAVISGRHTDIPPTADVLTSHIAILARARACACAGQVNPSRERGRGGSGGKSQKSVGSDPRLRNFGPSNVYRPPKVRCLPRLFTSSSEKSDR